MKSSDHALKGVMARLVPEGWVAPSPERLAELEHQEREARRAEHEQAELARTGDHLRACGVEDEALNELLSGKLQPSMARAGVAAFLADETRHLLLLRGPPSSGKTLAAAEAFLSQRVAIDSPYFGRSWKWGRPGRLIRAQGLASLSAYGDEREEFERLVDLPLVVLDDLGVERVPIEGVLDELVGIRYAKGRKLIITTNLDNAKFKARYDERIAERIRHRGIVQACTDPSFRSGVR